MFGTCRQTCTTCSMLQVCMARLKCPQLVSAIESMRGLVDVFRVDSKGDCSPLKSVKGLHATQEGPTSYCKIAAC